jgi:2-keto-3-deoxy-L-rhamnonate aldolase RhmA
MRTSLSLARLREGRVVRICALSHYLPAYVAHAARAGFDCIWLDLEHRAMERREVEMLLAQCHLHNIDCLLRSPTREKVPLYRYLEDGATGLMIPLVNTAQEARDLAAAVKFPPLGERGVDNAGLDSNYHANPDNLAYIAAANRETFLVVQIETPAAVDNCEEIAATPGVDAVFVGPGDLGLRLTLAGDLQGERLEASIAKVAAACARHGKAWGCPVGSTEALRQRRAQGAQLLCNFGEYMYLLRGLAKAAEQFEHLG